MIVALMQLPPPIHGAALRNAEFLKFLRSCEDVEVVNLAPKQDIGSLGRFSAKKLGSAIQALTRLLAILVRNYGSIESVYITPAPSGFALCRDAFLAWIAASIFRLPVAAHFRAVGVARHRGFALRFLRLAFAEVRAVTMSATVSKDIAMVFPEDRISVVQNGLAAYSPSLRTLEGREEFRILHLSNLSASKGTFDVLQAFSEFQAKFPNARLVVVGSWANASEEARFHNEVESSGCKESIRLVGSLYGEDKWSEFVQSDVFLFPSLYEKECFPGVVMEAMSAGLPVIAYAHAAVPDIIRNGVSGWVVECGDVRGLVASLGDAIIDRAKLTSMSHRAFKDFYENYRAEVTHPMLLRLLRAPT